MVRISYPRHLKSFSYKYLLHHESLIAYELVLFLDVMKALLDAKSNCNLSHVDVESPDKNGRTPFHIACIYGHYEAAKTLIENGEANPMVRNNKYLIIYYNIPNHYVEKDLIILPFFTF